MHSVKKVLLYLVTLCRCLHLIILFYDRKPNFKLVFVEGASCLLLLYSSIHNLLYLGYHLDLPRRPNRLLSRISQASQRLLQLFFFFKTFQNLFLSFQGFFQYEIIRTARLDQLLLRSIYFICGLVFCKRWVSVGRAPLFGIFSDDIQSQSRQLRRTFKDSYLWEALAWTLMKRFFRTFLLFLLCFFDRENTLKLFSHLFIARKFVYLLV